jgi:hypothetical protein
MITNIHYSGDARLPNRSSLRAEYLLVQMLDTEKIVKPSELDAAAAN